MDLYNLVLTAKIQKGGGGPSVEVEPLSVTENGTYTASSGHAFSPVSVNVPIPSGYIQPTGTSSITENGIYNISSFASVDVNVSGGGGDHDAEDGIIQRTITSYFNSTALRIGNSAFLGCISLSTVEMTNVVSIGNSAFTSCSILQKISFPMAQSIGNYCFSACRSLTSVYMPNLSNIGPSAFVGCSSLTSVDFPNALQFGSNALAFCPTLSCVRIGKSLSSAYTGYFYPNVFYGCKSLMEVYLLYSKNIPTLTNSNIFISTPMVDSSFTGAFGSIYVPASLVASYKSSVNWSYYSDRITSYVE